MKIIRIFQYIAFAEILAFVGTFIYIDATENLELGAVVMGFLFLIAIIYYGLYCAVLDGFIKNEKAVPLFSLLLFNLLPIVAYTCLFIFG